MEEKLTEVNLAKNRIYIHFQGRLDFPRALRLQKAYREAINKVKPGFTVITFAANYSPGDEEVQKVVAQMTQMAEKMGVKKVARVVGATPLGGMQINRLAKMATKYPARHFATLEEAEAYLDNDKD